MNESTFKEFLDEYFEENYELLSFVKIDIGSLDVSFKCNISCEEEVKSFVDVYMKETNETIKLKYKQKEKPKSIYNIKSTYRCHHDTRYERTREIDTVLDKNPFKRLRNTNCPFQMKFKVLKFSNDKFVCNVNIEHCHNHAVNSLEALSFKQLSTSTRMEIEGLFTYGFTPSQAYHEFLRNLQSSSEDELHFHIQKADRSKCPRRRDFNSLYIKYCNEKFGGRNGVEMFDELEKRISEFIESNEGTKISFQLYDKDLNSALILAIVTSLMQRVHSQVFTLMAEIFPGRNSRAFPKIWLKSEKEIFFRLNKETLYPPNHILFCKIKTVRYIKIDRPLLNKKHSRQFLSR